jgi:hypothetical protein
MVWTLKVGAFLGMRDYDKKAPAAQMQDSATYIAMLD